MTEFRGLTIRLGADTRSLKSALSSINSAAKKTESELRQIQKMLKLDGTDAKALSSQFATAENRMQLLARSTKTLDSGLKQASSAMKQLEASTKNVHAEAERLDADYTRVTSDLAVIYRDMTLILQQQKNITSYTKAKKELESLKAKASGVGKEAREAKQQLRALLEQAAKTGTAEKFGLMAGDAKKLEKAVKNLRIEHNVLQTQLSNMQGAEEIRKYKIQLQAVEAEMKQAATEAASFRATVHAVGGDGGAWSESISKVKSLDNLIEQTRDDVRVLSDVAEALPGDFDAWRMKMQASANESNLLKERIEALKKIIKQIESTPGFDKVKASTANAAASVEKAKAAYAEVAREIAIAEENQIELTRRAREYEQSGKDKRLKEYRDIKKALKESASEMEKLRQKQKALDNQLKASVAVREQEKYTMELKKSLAALKKLGASGNLLKGLQNAFRNLRTMSYGLNTALTASLMMLGRYAIQAAEKVDSAYRDMRKTVNGTEEQFEYLKDAALEYSRTHITSAETILEIEAMGGQLGIAVQNLEAFATTVSNLDIATNMDADTIAEQLGKMASVVGISVDEYDNFGDALVRLGNNLPVMEGDIMTLMTRFMGMGKVVGMDADEMLGWAAAASATGQKAEAAGSSMQRFISKVETAVLATPEQEELWGYLELYTEIANKSKAFEGSIEDFQNLFNEDASSALFAVVDGLGEMQKSGDSVNKMLGKLGINNVRDKQLLEGLAVQSANAADGETLLAEALRMSNDAYEGRASILQDEDGYTYVEKAGDAAREAENKSKGFSGQLEMMYNNAKALAVELSEGALPYLRDLGSMFQNLTAWVKGLPDGLKQVVVGLAGIATAMPAAGVGIGAVGYGLSKVAEFVAEHNTSIFQKMADGIQSIAPSAKDATTRLGKMSGIISKLSWGKILAVAAAIAVVVGAIKSLYDRFKKINSITNDFKSRVLDTMPQTLLNTGKGFDRLGSGIEKAVYSFDEFIDRNSKLVDSIQGRNESTQVEIETLEEAYKTLEKYSGKTNLTAEEIGEFRIALKYLNENLETNYSMLDSTTGIIVDEKGAVHDLSDAYRDLLDKKLAALKEDALMENWKELNEAQRQNRKDLVAARKEMDDAFATYDAMKNNPLTSSDALEASSKAYYEAAANYAVMKETVENTDAAMKYIEQDMSALAKGSSILKESWADTFSAFFGDENAVQLLNTLRSTVTKAGVSLDELNNLTDEQIYEFARMWYETEGDVEKILQHFGISVKSFADTISDSMGKIEDGITFDKLAEKLGVSTDTLAEKIANANISIEAMAALTNEKVSELWEQAGGDLSKFLELLHDFDANEVHHTKVEVESEGVEETANAIQDIDGTDAEATVSTDTTDADEGYAQVEAEGEEYDESEYSSTVTVNDQASAILDSIKYKLESIAKTWYVDVEAQGSAAGGVFNASGGISSNYINAIPRNASGGLNGIVTRATLTNVGWVGEAGDEALLHMRHAGGAIIPLSNRQHVRPFARAVASEMTYGGDTTIYNITIDGNTINDDPEIRAVVTDVIRVSSRRAAMNRG